MTVTPNRAEAERLDAGDPLRHTRERFLLPDGVIYLDGNSLGPLPAGVPERVGQVLSEEWGQGLIRSWNTAGWMQLPARVAGRIAGLVGADADEVMVSDSTSVMLFKLLYAAVRMRPGRGALVSEPTTFPTDGYIAASVAELLGLEHRWCDPEDPLASVDEDTAVLALTHVDFRTGRKYDEAAITRGAHAAGALMLWDLCHSVGAVPFDLHAADVDLAVGCTYKYVNGGPGSPAFGYAARRLHDELSQPITGWIGHAAPFAMERDYRPAPGVARLRSGTPAVLGLSSLQAALDAFADVSMPDLRAKSLALTDLFIGLVREHTDCEVVTPLDHDRRGSQVSLRHPRAYGVVQALIDRGVIGDFREPDIARFGFAPLYLRFVDVFDAVQHLREVLAGREFDRPAYATRAEVT